MAHKKSASQINFLSSDLVMLNCAPRAVHAQPVYDCASGIVKELALAAK